MYVFAIAALFGLGVMTLASFADRYLSVERDYHAMVVVALGMVGAWVADFNLFARYNVPVRSHWIGVIVTGLAIAGLARAWHEVLGFFSGLTRKTNDEAAAIERGGSLKAA